MRKKNELQFLDQDQNEKVHQLCVFQISYDLDFPEIQIPRLAGYNIKCIMSHKYIISLVICPNLWILMRY